MTVVRDDHRYQVRDPEAMVTDDYYVEQPYGLAQVARVVALIAGGAVTLIGLIALVRIDWTGADLTRPIADVGGMTFTPIVAAITALVGIVLLAVAAGRSGDARVAIGAILATVGVAVLAVSEFQTSWNVSERQGWLSLGIGALFVLTGMVGDGRRVIHRRATTERPL